MKSSIFIILVCHPENFFDEVSGKDLHAIFIKVFDHFSLEWKKLLDMCVKFFSNAFLKTFALLLFSGELSNSNIDKIVWTFS